MDDISSCSEEHLVAVADKKRIVMLFRMHRFYRF